MQLAREGVPIVGLNWNDENDSARDWLTRLGDPYVVTAVDVDGRVAIEVVGEEVIGLADWGVYGAPETFLVDGKGTIIHKHIGPLSRAIWQRDFVPRIAQLAGEGPRD